MVDLSLDKNYNRRNISRLIILAASISLMLLLAVFSVALGTAEVSMSQVFGAIIHLFDRGASLTADESRIYKIILLLRMPRVVLGVLAGIGLSISGTVMQSISRNPLVSPFTIGLSSAAAFGASIAIVLGIGFRVNTPFGIVINAFVMSLVCALLVYGIANRVGMSPEALILTGVALNYLFSALTATLHFVADENQLSAAIQWTFGSLNGATWSQVIFVLVMLLAGIAVLIKYSWILNAMASSGDEFITGIGINPEKTRSSLGLITVLITSSIISFTGVIGFVGLIGPHIARLTIGSDHRFLIPVSGLLGGILLLLSDTIGRTILSPVTIPVGIVISYVGVPLFVYLIIMRRKEFF